jgi:hypothetical protein
MQPKRIGWFPGLLMIFFVILAILAGSGDNSPAGISTKQGWRLDTFDNLAIKIDGQLFDKGVFVNETTGQALIAYCTKPNAADPSVNDIFTLSGNKLYPVSNGIQTFQIFQIVEQTPTLRPIATFVPTQTPMPTPTPITTFKGKVTHVAREAAGIAIYLAVFATLIGGWILLQTWGNK